jgi:hypothetical protein
MSGPINIAICGTQADLQKMVENLLCGGYYHIEGVADEQGALPNIVLQFENEDTVEGLEPGETPSWSTWQDDGQRALQERLS